MAKPVTSRFFTPTRRLDAIVLANFLALGILIAAVPRYLHVVLKADRFHTGLATTIYFVAALLMRPFVGGAVDRIGRRPFIVAPPVAIAGLTFWYLRTHSVWGVTILRFLAGGFAALFFTAVALAATDLVPAENRTRALGRQSVMTYTGFVIGPVLVDRLLQYGWTLVWVVPACLHLLTSALAFTLTETRPAESKPASSRAGFDRRVLRPAIGILVANFTFASVVTFLPEYAERMEISRPGSLFATYAASVLIVRSLTGRLADRIGPARFMVPSLAFGGLGLLVLTFTSQRWQSYVGLAIVGMGIGGTFPAATSAALARVGPTERGKAMGTAFALGDVGQATAGPLIGYLSTAWGFRWVYGIPAILTFASLYFVATMPEARRARVPTG